MKSPNQKEFEAKMLQLDQLIVGLEEANPELSEMLDVIKTDIKGCLVEQWLRQQMVSRPAATRVGTFSPAVYVPVILSALSVVLFICCFLVCR